MSTHSPKPLVSSQTAPEPLNSRVYAAMALPKSLLDLDDIKLSHLALDIPKEPSSLKASSRRSILTAPISSLSSVEDQTRLFTLAEQLWRSWQAQPDIASMLMRYVEVCAFKKPIPLRDMRWHQRLTYLGLVKYYLCFSHLEDVNRRAQLWEHHCTLTLYRLHAQCLRFSPTYSSCRYSLSGVEASRLPLRADDL
ncbi:hypothetical protein [Vibrio breoganii]|uniref:hypothetical protein n=1 Tax=Vibrio breoganii TaxID=553239 RepID=UPI00080D8E27|nr:hypothetical protein [Vibrio breoganii]OCH75799.1 hypothetical protein A6D95_01935 [Vibrio breoganii]